MISYPCAKINIGLRIIRKRPDGYHELETCMVPVPWRDMLEIIESDRFSFQSSGLAIPGDADDNLCVKAYRLLQQDFDLPPVQIHLHKIIPMGAGLGGGSSDASAVLTGLNTLFALSLDPTQLEAYAARLGSDCPFFVQARPRLAHGTGTELLDTTLDVSGTFAVLVYPNAAVTTAEAYANVVPEPSEVPLQQQLETLPPTAWKGAVVNDFERSVFPQHPELEQIKAALYEAGAFYASLSGSGSTVYGLFEEAVTLPGSFDRYTVWSGVL